jgi:hypothetical protein
MADLELAAGKRGRDAATVLQWAGISLLGIFLTLLASSAWPLALLQPAWLQKMSDIVQNLGVNALMGAVLLVLAQLLNPKEVALEQRVWLVRRLASWAAIGFVLLIPLQAYSGVTLLRERTRREGRELDQIEQATKAIEAATTETELRIAIGRFPGSPPNLPARFNQPFGELRDRLADQLRPRLKEAEARLAEARRNRWQAWLKKWLRDGIYSLFLALGFAAIGQAGPDRPTLLAALFSRRANELWKPFESSTGKAPGTAKKEENPPRKPSWLQKPPPGGSVRLPWSKGKKSSVPGIPREWLPEKPRRPPEPDAQEKRES